IGRTSLRLRRRSATRRVVPARSGPILTLPSRAPPDTQSGALTVWQSVTRQASMRRSSTSSPQPPVQCAATGRTVPPTTASPASVGKSDALTRPPHAVVLALSPPAVAVKTVPAAVSLACKVLPSVDQQLPPRQACQVTSVPGA